MIGGFVYLQRQINHPVSKQENYQIFIINQGETVKEIAENLANQGLVRSGFFFRLYFKQLEKSFNKSLTIKAGTYKLSPHLNIPEITEKLIYGLIESQDIKVVIPEGYNVFEIGGKLEENGLAKQKEFFEAARSKEGYLFPDTYQFKKGSSIQAIISKMSANFDKKAAALTQDKDVITIASLIEKEVVSYDDRRIVSGILWKRIEKGMPLQIDSSILYAKMLALNNAEPNRKNYVEKQDHNPVSIDDTKIDSLYNTYKYKGLPPGPICNPGTEVIRATLNPIQTDYWYYLSSKDGKTIFSKTYEEHLKNKEKYLR